MSPSLAVAGTRGIREAWLPGFAVLCVGQFLGHQTGLTFSVLIPILSHDWRLSAGQAGAILGAFQFGQLIAYALVGFLLDQIRSKPVMVWSAALVGLGDILFAAAARNFASGFALRLLGGLLVGGLYVPALKYIADSVPQETRGRSTGVFIAVLVAAYAAPLLYVGVLAPRVGWRSTMAAVGALELAASAVLATSLPDVPLRAARAGAGVGRYVRDVLRNRAARRVILAYASHNWELFGMWGWLTPFMVAALAAHGRAPAPALAGGGALAAAVIGVGGSLGAIAGGRLSDHIGRARAASLMLAVSLLCSLGYGWLLQAPVPLLAAVGLLYGTTSLADSPSYSASLMEVVPARSLGGAFSIQMLFGWSATVMAPPAFGLILDFMRGAHAGPAASWAAAFGALAVGPAIGLIALTPMRRRQRVHAAGDAEITRKRPDTG